MKRRLIGVSSLFLILLLTLTGCFFRNVNDLYTVPQPSKNYEALQVCLSEVINRGGEYAAPLTGELIQSVQLQDLDSDGKQEAIAFFRLAEEEKPLKIYIFRQEEERYETLAVIEGAGTAINCVDYVQLNDDSVKEIAVSWQISDKLYSLAVYSIRGGEVEELLRTDYDSYKFADLDQDSQQELVVFRTPLGVSLQAELYDFDGGVSMTGTAGLSAGVTTVDSSSVRTGYLTNRIPALFVTSAYGESGSITDIFACRNGQLQNITLSPETGESSETIRFYNQVAETDINGDGIMELPQPVPLMEHKITTASVNFWMIYWRQFDADGNAKPVFTTYHNDRDGWYFILPDWWGNDLTLSRSDLPGGGERAVTFSYWEGDEAVSPKPFLTIYKLTGSSRMARAQAGNRFLIFPEVSGTDTVYAAEFLEGWDCGLTEDDVRERFVRIKTDWYNGY